MSEEIRKEIDIMSRCRSSFVLQLFCFAEDSGKTALVLELMDKGSLYDVLRNKNEALPWLPQRWQIACDFIAG
jgi:serine/threonine protein kinase